MSLDRTQERQQRRDRSDAFAEYVRTTCEKLDEAKALAIMAGPPRVLHALVEHDDTCMQRITGRGSDCTCEPTVSFYVQPENEEIAHVKNGGTRAQ